jgi:nitrite reductase/ring-hydroxylating ferredoxin subunit
MVAQERLICRADELEDGGLGKRFEIDLHGQAQAAFVVRHGGRVYGYLNRCGHIPVELDWQPGAFFDHSRLYLLCSTHGALYDPASGACVGGRCNGRGLSPLAVEERSGGVFLIEMDSQRDG